MSQVVIPEHLSEVVPRGTDQTAPEKPVVDEVAKLNYSRYIRARDGGHTEYCKEAAKFDRFYCDDQWEEADKKKLDSEGRPALTINMIRPTINAVLGEQIARRADYKIKHKRNGSEEIAALLTKVYMSISDDNRLDYVEQAVFADGLIQDRGFFDVRIGFNENMMGEVVITSKDPLSTIIDPDAKEYDPRTWGEMFSTGWMSLDDIGVTYGQEFVEKLNTGISNNQYFREDSVLFHEKRFGTITEPGGDANGAPVGSSPDSRTLKKVRVIDRQYYKMAVCRYFVDPETGDSKAVSESWDDARATEFAAKYGLFLHRKMERKVRWTVTADQVVLHDAWSPYSSFTIVPYFPYFRRGRPVGMVRGLISPQELLNKVSSQELHIVNTTANSGYIVEDGALSGGMTVDDLKRKGSTTGFVLQVARNRMEGVSKIQPNQIPTGLDRIGMKAQNNFRLISGVNESMLGIESPEVSGVALEQNKNSGSVQIDVPLANMNLTRSIMSEKILELIQDFYTEERILQVADPVHPDVPVEEVVINQRTAAGEILNNITLGEYSIIISNQPARDNFADSQFAELIMLRNAGVAIPDDRVIERSNLEDKFALAKEIREITGRGPLTEEQMMMQQMQQQMALQHLQLELMELEKQIGKLESETDLNKAKTAAELADINAQREALSVQAAKTREEISLRERLAVLTATNKLDATNMASRAKMNQMLLERKLGDKEISGS